MTILGTMKKLTNNELIFASMNPSEALEFTKGDKEKIKFLREVKAKQRALEHKNVLQYINDKNIIYGDKKASEEETEKAIRRENIRDKKLEKYFIAEKPKPTKPKPIPFPQSADEFMELNDMLDTIDPSWWLPDDPDKKVQVEENLFDKYIEMLKNGELLPGTTFQMFEKNFMDYDTETISKIKKEINKRMAAKKRNEGLAALIGISPGRIKT